MTKKQYRVIVIGGGASGMAAAIAALAEAAALAEGAQRHCNKGKNNEKQISGKAQVLLLESNDRIGRKLLATGNGKCNFTHENVDVSHYHTDDRAVLTSVLSTFPTKAAVSFFEKLGMLSKEKNGYYYPYAETASTVLNVLRLRLLELGCEIICGVCVEKAEKSGDGFFVVYEEKEKVYKVYAENIILATGSKAGGFLQNKKEDPLRLAQSFGLHSTPLYPALTKCTCIEDYYYKQLAGVRAQAILKLYAENNCGENVGEGNNSERNNSERNNSEGNDGKGYDCERNDCEKRFHDRHLQTRQSLQKNWKFLRQEAGELQLTKEGISGIAVFQLSGTIAQKLAEKKRVFVEINFLPDFPEEKLEDWAKKRLSLLPQRSLEDFFLGVLHKKVLDVCLQAEGLKGTMRISYEDDNAIVMVLSVMKRALHFVTEVTNVSDMKQAQVCRGGLLLSQFNEKLECKTVPRLFACGEVLNVDGECGGYNLHFAWASGVMAGRGAMRRNVFR